MLNKIGQFLTFIKPVLSRRTWFIIYLSSLLIHLILVFSLGELRWEIQREKWKTLRPTTQKIALTLEEREPPPPPLPPPEKSQSERKASKNQPKPAQHKSSPSRSRPVPKEVARIQSVNDLMEPYELARNVDDQESSSEEFDEFASPTPVNRAAKDVSETRPEQIEDLQNLSKGPSAYRGNPEGSRDGLPGGFEGFQGSFSSYLGLLRRAGLDVVFVIDSTGSMGWIIEQVKTKITRMMDVIRKLVPSARIGLVAYRDRGEEYLTRSLPLTFEVSKLRGFLADLQAKEGGDWEEAVEEGLRTAMEGIRWRKTAKKVIIVVGDAPPHKKDMKKALQVINQFRLMGGFVSTIDAGHESNDKEFTRYDSGNVLPEFVELAVQGQGEATNLGGQKKIIQQLVILTFGSRWQEVMAEYVEGL